MMADKSNENGEWLLQFLVREERISVWRATWQQTSTEPLWLKLGSLHRDTGEWSSTLQENCTDAERNNIDRWWQKRQQVLVARAEQAVFRLPAQISAAEEWMLSCSDSELAKLAPDILGNWRLLRARLLKLGLL